MSPAARAGLQRAAKDAGGIRAPRRAVLAPTHDQRPVPQVRGRQAVAERALRSSKCARALERLLRVYEGCACAYLGEIEGANVIKLLRHFGKVSYLVYPGFETDPHPALLRSVKLSLRTREIDCLEYAASANPPDLHRKEAFLTEDHPLHARFARLSKQEEKYGLLDDTATIGTREGWQARLGEAGVATPRPPAGAAMIDWPKCHEGTTPRQLA